MRDEPEAELRRLPEMLPEYYRENPGELGPALRIGDEMVASAGAHLSRARARLSDDLLLSLKERWFPSGAPVAGHDFGGEAGGRGGGTQRELLRWFRVRAGRSPIIWAGFEVRPIGVDRLRLHRSARPAAVLVWDAAGLSASSPPEPPPPEMVPLRTRLQLILPLSEDDVRVSVHGRVLRARVLFDSHASTSRRDPGQ